MPTLLDAAGLEIPGNCTGRSLLPVIRGEETSVRELLHGEHAGCYEYGHGNHFLTDGGNKYVWYSQSGREHLFDLEADPQEERDLALLPDGEGRLAPWRGAARRGPAGPAGGVRRERTPGCRTAAPEPDSRVRPERDVRFPVSRYRAHWQTD